MGYLVTLDMFGYAYSQVSTVPFLVLAKALGDTSSEFKKRQAKWILETCDAIYKQSSILREDNKKLFENYMKSPANRTIEHIPNNLVFLGHLLCALRCGDINAQDVQRWLQEGFMKSLIEETIRRRLNKWQDIEKSMEDISKVLGINQKVYIDEPVEEFEKGYAEYFKFIASDKNENSHYTDAFKKALADSNVMVETVKEETVKEDLMDEDLTEVPKIPTVKEILYDPNTYKIPDYANNIITKIKNTVTTFVEIILRYNKIFESGLDVSFDIPEFEFIEGKAPLADAFFDNYNSKVILATFLQAFLHRQNSVRREAIEAGQYYEPFSKDTADKLLAAHFDEYVLSNLKKKTNDIVNAFADQKGNALSLNFWRVDKIEEAAGLLLVDVKFRGSKVYGQILKALQKSNMPLAQEKIEMVISGRWQGITLFVDKPKNPDDPGN
jgi:hypothetical protein